MISNGVLQQTRVKTRLTIVRVGVDNIVSRLKTAVKVSWKLSWIASIYRNIYFWPVTSKYRYESVHHLYNFEESVHIFRLKKDKRFLLPIKVWRVTRIRKIVEFVQVFADKTATTLKTSVLVDSRMHVNRPKHFESIWTMSITKRTDTKIASFYKLQYQQARRRTCRVWYWRNVSQRIFIFSNNFTVMFGPTDTNMYGT